MEAGDRSGQARGKILSSSSVFANELDGVDRCMRSHESTKAVENRGKRWKTVDDGKPWQAVLHLETRWNAVDVFRKGLPLSNAVEHRAIQCDTVSKRLYHCHRSMVS